MKKRITAVLLLVICIFTTLFYENEANASEATNNKKQSIGYVFIGDSRTVGMNMAVNFDQRENKFMVAKVGMGYKWFINEGSAQLKEIRQNNNFDKWIYIFNMGINDLYNVDKYIELVNKLSEEATVYYLSVNPTIDSKTSVQCSEVEQFNKIIVDNYQNYIDSYHYLKNIGYDSNDGLHYNNGTYQDLYKFIKVSVKVNEFLRENEKNSPDVISYMYN